MAAETIALVEAIGHAIYVSEMLCQVLYNTSGKVTVTAITDNKSLYQSAHSTTSITDKRLRIELGIIREYISNKEISLSWIESKSLVSWLIILQNVVATVGN